MLVLEDTLVVAFDSYYSIEFVKDCYYTLYIDDDQNTMPLDAVVVVLGSTSCHGVNSHWFHMSTCTADKSSNCS